MRIFDIINSPWAIVPEKLEEIRKIYMTHLRGEKIDIKAVEDRLGKPLNNERKPYDIVNGVAVIPVHGVIAQRMNLFSQISGGVSTQLLSADFKAALNDDAVNSILLDIDSPGGTVSGTFELANLIHESRGTKPIIAFTDNTMASAAYAIGSAADKIYISGDTTAVGAIGVVTSHVDISEAEKKEGIKTTEIYAGKYKRIASQFEPLSSEGKKDIQNRVDYLYGVFVAGVAKNRGVSEETVLTNMADGKIFIGKQALNAGLVDGVSTFDRLMNVMADKAEIVTTNAGDAEVESINLTEESVMTKDELKEKHPEIYQAIHTEGVTAGDSTGRTEGLEAGIMEGTMKGVATERKRIQDVEAQSMPGHEALIASLKFDGVTTGEQAAVKVLAAEKSSRANQASNIASGAAPMLDADASEQVVVDMAGMSQEEKIKATWDKDKSLHAEFNNNFNAYSAWFRADANGSAKVLNGGK